ncbi:XRE family transcriptional regulator [Amycolatopsis mediterranei S699]|uniref:XRE family transcriptional regulator n=2 Tax=Amycolatopsis mediterranei TaxID=33910 RepID=A0A0H3D7I4_AMYMU|nr:helix-turn-helix transcriptional regulator [Amycolatopsis mediterranei]ADJ45499.1 XRE family transcriptional regulator [Amycolatopsis mediterranei U32]AEK42272.1 XRE family transcriptional regulator [Amycolatopsis mediterranei S699]AFO77211.1 XRE family transcriptional regulator [Amycolatopsis mediterranei S699]AGT84339.1 XRE family transcriptional regulator [Amycolatopsis mediterranei RB]KDO06078.1 XRE family transcriptional regulator [Amycolatopsis mediterranei]
MSTKSTEVRDFLVTRRAKITPEQAGLQHYGGNRRVAGLRREEVALLAGVSADYYTRVEKGNLAGDSDSVLDAIAAALQLDEAERVYLFDLARAANAAGRPRTAAQRRRSPHRVRPVVQQILDSMTSTAAFVRNGRLDILATNLLGRALYSPVFDSPTRPSEAALPNLARFGFLDPAARDYFPDYDKSCHTSVAILRTEAGRDPHNRDLSDLVGELSTRSDDFRTRWAAHDVRLHRTGTKHFRHPVVGELTLDFEAMELSADAGLTLTAYAARPDSGSAERLQLLATWAATERLPAGR